MTKLTTRANVEEYARQKGWDLMQIDGIPDGFSWKEPDITIGTMTHKGRIIKIKPLTQWEEAIIYGE